VVRGTCAVALKPCVCLDETVPRWIKSSVVELEGEDAAAESDSGLGR
jgi:hypothetical protein